jgi:hypothetical protein
MSDDLERLLRSCPGAPAHGRGFDARLWSAIEGVDRELDHDDVRAHEPAEAPTREGRERARSRSWLAVAAAAAAIIAILVLASATRHAVHELRQPPPASAAEVIRNVRHSLSTFRTLSATVVSADGSVEGPSKMEPGWTSADWFARARVTTPAVPISDPKRIVATADGRLRVETPVTGTIWSTGLRPDGSVEVTKDTPELKFSRDVPAKSVDTSDDRIGVASWYSPGYAYEGTEGRGGAVEQALLTVGVPLGPPDLEGFASSWMSTEGLSVSALSVLARGTVSATTYDRRPALVVAADVTPGPVVASEDGETLMFYGEFDRIAITVDEATWFPVRYTTTLHGEVVRDTRLTHVKLGVPVKDKAFSAAFPPGASVEKDDEGFRRVTLREATHAFDYKPLAPSLPPRGFRFFRAAIAAKSRFFVMTGAGDVEHEFWRTSRDITAVRYQSGFLTFTVTTRSAQGMHDPLLADPFARDPAQVAASAAVQTATLRAGALRGVQAKIAMPALGVPHLWAFHGGLMITIAGDLSERQLLKIAESLEPLR